MSNPLRIALLASARHPIAEPFAGGLEAHTWTLAHALRERGHRVSLFAGPGSDAELGESTLEVHRLDVSAAARGDASMPPEDFLAEHHAYLQVMLMMASEVGDDFDVVHNNSLHYLPVAMARSSRAPVLTTLHTPPTPWLESAIMLNPDAVFVAVSDRTAAAWRHASTHIDVIRNGIDLAQWEQGPGGGPLVWSGRIVPEKGLHLAILAARAAGWSLDIAGPISDRPYFHEAVQPLLDEQRRYVGHLTRRALSLLVGHASGALVTPSWDEPYGLVAAEALAWGTPVLGFARGALPEIVDTFSGILVAADDVAALATAIRQLPVLRRDAARARAQSVCSHERMVDEYCDVYAGLAGSRARARAA